MTQLITNVRMDKQTIMLMQWNTLYNNENQQSTVICNNNDESQM